MRSLNYFANLLAFTVGVASLQPTYAQAPGRAPDAGCLACHRQKGFQSDAGRSLFVDEAKHSASVHAGSELTYPFHDRTTHVTRRGRICLHRKKVNLSTVFAGQAVGIKEVEEGIWPVSFMEYDLGYIDLEEKTLQPLDNPFGPKVLPM